jgi:hypothetical protein
MSVSLQSLAKRNDDRINEIVALEPLDEDSADADILKGEITKTFVNDGSFKQFTGFEEGQISNWVLEILPFAAEGRKRGPPPKSSISDALLCYLVTIHLGADFPTLAKSLHLGESQFTSNVERIRVLLNHAMKSRWASLLPRPTEDVERNFPQAGLLVDTTTFESYKPKARFAEAEVYFDGHNWIYGLKVEIGVTTARPHFCAAVSPHSPGSFDDYAIHKRYYGIYMDYLAKTEEELSFDGDVSTQRNWAVIGDRKYIGPAGDTPGERRIVAKKKPVSTEDKRRNKEISTDRVYVEQFLGRNAKLFAVMREVYRYDHAKFDLDFENCCFLTNEAILLTALADEDGKFYRKLLESRFEKHQTELNKRKRGYEKYKRVKKAKLEKVQRYVRSEPDI